ncbi:hypothetical protein OROMI_004152 [Orobanche minor]
MKKALPTNGKIAKDAKDTVQECVLEFISFFTSEDIFVAVMMMVVVFSPIPLYFWRRRLDSRRRDQHEERASGYTSDHGLCNIPSNSNFFLLFVDCENLYDKQGERVVRATNTRRMRQRHAASSAAASTSSTVVNVEGMPRIFTDAEFAEIGSLEKVLSDEDDIGTWNTLKLQELTSISSDFVYCIS